MASPLPLAFFAFGVGSGLQSAYQLSLIPEGEARVFALIIGLFVFPLQALASVLSFAGRETVGATALGIISGSWLATAVVTYASPPSATTISFGLFLLALSVILVQLGVIGLQGKPVIAGLVLFAAVRKQL